MKIQTITIKIKPNDDLLKIDPQNDFGHKDGSLYVKDGEKIVKPLNDIRKKLILSGKGSSPSHHADIISRDWHPENSIHFQDWPKHCVQNTWGAEFLSGLDRTTSLLISKGTDPDDRKGFSAFEGRTENGIYLGDYLQFKGIRRLLIGGLATDYCVKATVLDALQKEGFEVVVILDAIRAVDLKPGDGDKALEEMEKAGALFTTGDLILL